MAKIYDRWHKSYPKPDDEPCDCSRGKNRLYPTSEHKLGDRWQVRWYDGKQKKRNFANRTEAEWQLAHLNGSWCLVQCGKTAVTEPPVLLCADHRDLLLMQLGRKRPSVHDPIVYFIRNGDRIKIGWTTHLKQRLSALALSQDAVELTLPGGPSEEAFYHQKFASARVGRTEWFEATPELESFIVKQKLEAA